MNEIQSFEEQLKKSVKTLSASNDELKKFEDQLKSSISQPSAPQQNTRTQQVRKNLLLGFSADSAGTAHYRLIFPFTFLNAIFGRGKLGTMISPMFIFQQNILAMTKTIFFQRQMSPSQYQAIQNYKVLQNNLKYRMVWDIDDFIWGKNEEQGGTKYDGVPSYNFGAKNITKEIKDTSVKIMQLMDKCTFSTQYLADYAKNTLKLSCPCEVLPNTIAKYFWGEDKKPDITNKLTKPVVLYTGSPTHYSNERKMLGDFNNSWREWVLKSVKENKIEFHVMGGLPWFFDGIKDKIKVYTWVDSLNYHTVVKGIKADIGIGPLVPNNFNYSKSDLKYLEYIAMGIPMIGTVFTNGMPSPYDVCKLKVNDNCSTNDIDKIFNELLEPEFYNKIKNEQYQWMDDNHRWTEDQTYITELTRVLLT